ncbi:MAG: hypothetical protein QOH99_1468, partial [Frankiaceae bacterium]|nr:hypothetical protein [Frankiaceae bacterium]
MPGRAPTIGVLTPLAGGHYFGSVLSGIAASAGRAGGRVIAIQTLEAGLTSMESMVEPDFRMPVADAAIDGYVVVLNSAASDYLRELQDRGKPVVVVSYDIPGLVAPVVGPDNALGVRQAVTHLIDHGHRSIAFVGSMAHADVRERRAAYEETLRDHGITPDPTLFYDTRTNVANDGRAAGEQMLADGIRSSATVAGTDYTAMGVMEALIAGGLNLPRDQAIVGFDDLEICSYLAPPLSTVTQNYELIGATAGDLVLRALNGDPAPAVRHYVPTVFVPRESCGCDSALRVGPGVATLPADASTAESVCHGLAELLVDTDATPELRRRVDFAAAAVAAALDAAHFSTTAGPTPHDLDQAWQALYDAAPSEAGIAAVLRAVRDIGRARHGSSVTLEDFLHESMLAMARAQMRAQLAGAETLRSLLRTQYDVGLDLLRSHEEDPRSLRWLNGTTANAACFGAWTVPTDGGPRELNILSTFSRGAEGHAPDVIGTTVSVPDFPPLWMTSVTAATAEELILYV